ncbi:VWA domain-containing protein, partial [Streptomyces violascens]
MSVSKIQHKVNHVALVVDCSGSMRPHQSQLIRVVDEFVAGLKAESDSLGHETRISLYSFDHQVENLVWDMDVKHLPSMRGLYQVNNGATALIEASLKSLDDLGHIWEQYGEHSFLQIVVTDGEENASGGD